MNRLSFQELFDNAEPKPAELLIKQGLEELSLELLKYPKPFRIVLDEVPLLGHSGKQNLKMRFAKCLQLFLLDKLSQNLRQPQRIPHQRRTRKFISESGRSIDHRSELDHMRVEHIISNLRSHMQQNVEISLA
jgi:hypothetical protein